MSLDLKKNVFVAVLCLMKQHDVEIMLQGFKVVGSDTLATGQFCSVAFVLPTMQEEQASKSRT
eukprot:1160430-Pelagomonas_calceolata.AAC.1